MSYLFGENLWLAAQVINVFLIALSFYFLAEISRILWGNGRIGQAVEAACILFFPVFFYSTFVYGNIPGLFFSVLTIYFLARFYFKPDLCKIVCGVLCMSMALTFKTNNLIVWLALVILLLYLLIMGEKKICVLAAFVIMIFTPAATFHLNSYVISEITGEPPSRGIPSTAYIAMGLQDTKIAPGWWNGYNWNIFEENNQDYEKTNSASLKQIRREFEKIYENKASAVRRFCKKTASQWNNPDFQSFEMMSGRAKMNGDASSLEISLSKGNINNVLRFYMNIYQTWVLSGILLYIIFRNKNCDHFVSLVPAVIFIGGFLFHLVWEAKCQYTLPYFMLIIPYCVKGYAMAFQAIRLKSIKISRNQAIGIAIIILSIFIISKTTVFTKIIGLNDDTCTYKISMNDTLDNHE